MATVNVSTTYEITPDNKTIDGFQKALAALVTAGAPRTSVLAISPTGVITLVITDASVRAAMAALLTPTGVKIEPVPVSR